MGRKTLGKDQRLISGESLESDNGQFRAVMQDDGNFVVYEGEKPLWASNTRVKHTGYVEMQADGNLVVYDTTHVAQWSSDSFRHTPYSSVTLELGDDGVLVITTEDGELWRSA